MREQRKIFSQRESPQRDFLVLLRFIERSPQLMSLSTNQKRRRCGRRDVGERIWEWKANLQYFLRVFLNLKFKIFFLYNLIEVVKISQLFSSIEFKFFLLFTPLTHFCHLFFHSKISLIFFCFKILRIFLF